MIRTDTEYRRALERLEEGSKYLKLQKEEFQKLGLKGEELERVMGPIRSFHEQVKEEITLYERMKHGDLGTLNSLTSIGYWLIGLRIAKGWTQKELAKKLGVSEAQVSRDEVNEYHGITIDRAQRLFEIMGLQFKMEIEKPITVQQTNLQAV